MPDIIQTEEFRDDLLPLLRSFRFWNEGVGCDFERELAEWLDGDIHPTIARGGRVWLYRNAAGEPIGYGSLVLDEWVSRGGRLQLLIVPAVALRAEYQGKPEGLSDRGLKYSHQILTDLIAKAKKWIGASGLPPLLGLLTHPDNIRAVRLYRKFGFEPFDYVYVDPATGIAYPSHTLTLI